MTKFMCSLVAFLIATQSFVPAYGKIEGRGDLRSFLSQYDFTAPLVKLPDGYPKAGWDGLSRAKGPKATEEKTDSLVKALVKAKLFQQALMTLNFMDRAEEDVWRARLEDFLATVPLTAKPFQKVDDDDLLDENNSSLYEGIRLVTRRRFPIRFRNENSVEFFHWGNLDWSLSERWMYELSKMAGLATIPPTALRTIEDKGGEFGVGSIQLRVEAANELRLPQERAHYMLDTAQLPYLPARAELFLLHWLGGHEDKNASNGLATFGDEFIVALNFNKCDLCDPRNTKEGTVPIPLLVDFHSPDKWLTAVLKQLGRKPLERLSALGEQKFYEILGEYAPAEAIHNILIRFNLLVSIVDPALAIPLKIDPETLLTRGDIYRVFNNLSTRPHISMGNYDDPTTANGVTGNGQALLDFLGRKEGMNFNEAITFATQLINDNSVGMFSEMDYEWAWEKLLVQQATRPKEFHKQVSAYLKNYSPEDRCTNQLLRGLKAKEAKAP